MRTEPSALSKSVVTSCPQACMAVAVGLPQAPVCEKQWAVGHSFGLQGIYIFLGKTDAYTVTILWKQVQNAVGAFKAELPFWTGGVVSQKKLEGRLGICQEQVGVGYSMWRAWWEQRLGGGKINNSACSWSLRCREGREGLDHRSLSARLGSLPSVL